MKSEIFLKSAAKWTTVPFVGRYIRIEFTPYPVHVKIGKHDYVLQSGDEMTIPEGFTSVAFRVPEQSEVSVAYTLSYHPIVNRRFEVARDIEGDSVTVAAGGKEALEARLSDDGAPVDYVIVTNTHATDAIYFGTSDSGTSLGLPIYAGESKVCPMPRKEPATAAQLPNLHNPGANPITAYLLYVSPTSPA